MTNEMKTEMERLKRFLKGYESEPEPQEIDKISGDFQLAGLKPLIDHIENMQYKTKMKRRLQLQD